MGYIKKAIKRLEDVDNKHRKHFEISTRLKRSKQQFQNLIESLEKSKIFPLNIIRCCQRKCCLLYRLDEQSTTAETIRDPEKKDFQRKNSEKKKKKLIYQSIPNNDETKSLKVKFKK